MLHCHSLPTQSKLYQYCEEVEKQARAMFNTLVAKTKEAEIITEQLKEANQMEWVCLMQDIESRAREIIATELIYI